MRKSAFVVGTAFLALGIGFMLGQVGRADTAPVPGTANDPLVTKSYVDQKISQMQGGGSTGSGGGGSTTGSSLLQPVGPLHTGQTVTASTPGTEIIVRTGSAVVVDATGNGIPDVTGGNNILAGQAVPLNHLVIIPRTDGRGIQITGGQVFLMVAGGYQVNGQ